MFLRTSPAVFPVFVTICIFVIKSMSLTVRLPKRGCSWFFSWTIIDIYLGAGVILIDERHSDPGGNLVGILGFLIEILWVWDLVVLGCCLVVLRIKFPFKASHFSHRFSHHFFDGFPHVFQASRRYLPLPSILHLRAHRWAAVHGTLAVGVRPGEASGWDAEGLHR